MNDKFLAIYVNDHLAGSVAGIELVKRTAGNNEGTPLGSYLEGLRREVDEDRAALEAVMKHLGIEPRPLKNAAFWLAEKVGRLKLNGQLTGYSPLSRLVELEGLGMAVQGKENLWRALKRAGVQVEGIDWDELIARAERQTKELELHRANAVDEAFK